MSRLGFHMILLVVMIVVTRPSGVTSILASRMSRPLASTAKSNRAPAAGGSRWLQRLRHLVVLFAVEEAGPDSFFLVVGVFRTTDSLRRRTIGID